MADPGNPAPLPPALFVDQNEARRAEKKILRPGPLPFMSGSAYPPPPSLPLYGGLDPPMPVTKFLDVNERIYMILSFVPGEGLKVIESGFSVASPQTSFGVRLS